ncbi:DUF3489 domain-containing protein [Ruegeria sediminis]|uniref:DUF3489 domain-containing protein n=1 Tax=Ruegeria sediminis TaxID=2583820 RepID=A0ABY2WYV8_9RHOB|nr:DUF3489 domain-containing protein [Ruegeria sediminis]TMV08064.1 DUF3489 domain-containing protein [Ruegeria sediminis]
MSKTRQTKTDMVQALLRRPEGTSLADICKATGWQQHSARAALSTLRKKGATIERHPAQEAGAPATYHLIADAGIGL